MQKLNRSKKLPLFHMKYLQDLPNGQTAATASDMPQANIATQQTTTDATAPVSQQLISVQI